MADDQLISSAGFHCGTNMQLTVCYDWRFCPQEMVLDKDRDVIKPRYLMYDIMQFEVKLFFFFFNVTSKIKSS